MEYHRHAFEFTRIDQPTAFKFCPVCGCVPSMIVGKTPAPRMQIEPFPATEMWKALASRDDHLK